MTRITNSTLKRLLLIEKNDYELCRQYENNIENAKIIRLDITEKNMVSKINIINVLYFIL